MKCNLKKIKYEENKFFSEEEISKELEILEKRLVSYIKAAKYVTKLRVENAIVDMKRNLKIEND